MTEVIEQDKFTPVSVQKNPASIFIMQADEMILLDINGANKLTEVLRGFLDEKTKEGDPS